MADLSTLDPIFQAAGEEWDVHPLLLKAIASQESGGDTRAVSKANAQGLMQIIPSTQRYLGVTDPNNPAQSIYGAAKYMSEALDAEGGSPERALLFYHGGPQWRQAYGPESQGYVPAVTAHYVKLAKASQAAPQAPAASAAPQPAENPDIDPKTGLVDPSGNLSPASATPAPAASTEAGKAMPERKDEDYSDFLKRTGATGGDAAASKEPDYGDFLKRTGAAPSGVPQATTAQTADTPPIGSQVASLDPEATGGMPAPVQAAAGRVIDAAAEGWRNTEPALTPKGEAAVGPVGSFVSSALIDNPRRAFNALMGGVSQGVMEATAPVTAAPPGYGTDGGEGWGARLGRDVNQLIQVAPAAEMSRFSPRMSPDEIRVERRAADVAAEGGARGEAAAAGAASPEAGAPAGGPQPGMGGPQPQAAGAAPTPRGQAVIPTEEAARARTVADKDWFTSTQQPGVADTRILVPGVIPNLVEQEQSVVRARELKTLRNQNAEISQSERELLDHNSELRKNFYNDTAGSDVTRAADLKAAGEKIQEDLARVWRGKGEADPEGIKTQIAAELEGSAGHLPPLKSAMHQVSESLERAGTDPEAMYRTHRLINYLQSREGRTANPGYGDADVQAALTRTKKAVAAAIEPAAPGFGQAMADYSAVKGPLDAAKELQDRELKLYDSKGRMSYPAVHSLLRDVIKAQNWDAPNHPLQFVSEDQMNRLKALHDDLKRVASAHDLEMARGSDSAQNFMDIVKGVGKTGAAMGAHAVANAVAPVAGSFVVNALGGALEKGSALRQAKKQRRRGEEILRPEPPPNALERD